MSISLYVFMSSHSAQQTSLPHSPICNSFYANIAFGLFLKLFYFLCAGYQHAQLVASIHHAPQLD